MNRISLRKTRSLSPLSFEEVDAEIVCEDGKVFLEKRDEQGKTYTSLVESNIDFYKLITSNHVPGQYEARQLFLYTSSKCNLKCPVCYEEFDVTSEISVEQIKQILKGVKNKRVVLTGRESTCRPDIFEVIRVVAENNRAVLLTNGVKLADYDFVFRLKEVGLDSVIFSFDGFDDDVYRQMNGAALLKTKLKAFDNLKRVGIKTCLSLTLANGINDKEIKQICDLCIENRSFVYQLQVHASAPAGRHLETAEQRCLSEMVQLFTDPLQIPMADIIKEHAFWKMFVQEMDLLVSRSEEIKRLVMRRVCSFNFTVRKDPVTNKYDSFGNGIDVDAIARAAKPLKKALLVYYFVRAFGPRNIARNVIRKLNVPLETGSSSNLMVNLQCRPNIYTIDLEENKKCFSDFFKDGHFKPFCYSNILAGKNAVSQT